MGVMIGRSVSRPRPWLAREKARAFRSSRFPIRRQPPPDQLTERNAERLGLTIRTPAQFIG
jgi:hypothetical protein